MRPAGYYQAHKAQENACSGRYYIAHKEKLNARRCLLNYKAFFPHEDITKVVDEVGEIAACAFFRVKRSEHRKIIKNKNYKGISPAAEKIKVSILVLKNELKKL
jgi:hypothetical protein